MAPVRNPETLPARRVRLEVRGAVQGVGFRPWVWREAEALELAGWVRNDARGLDVEIEGSAERVSRFEHRLRSDGPPHARIESVRAVELDPEGSSGFEIRGSEAAGERTVAVLPDLATCDACLAEVLDRADRRFGYAFTNCTRCGPRFSIVRSLPYDRKNTTMEAFPLCPACAAEYADPRDRRFHAQPTACPACGPSLELRDPSGRALARGAEALARAAREIGRGKIVAVKGLGGFHLVCDAADRAAVARLRERKHREEKPFAILVRDVAAARLLCEVDATAERALTSPAAPILLLPRKPGAQVAPEVAPWMPTLGVMLPATPLHHLLARAVPGPVVATSGNRTDEPICTDEDDAVSRLGEIADLLLVHDRPIARHVDDSVAFVARGETRLLRRARGFAPLPVTTSVALPQILALGAHQKNAVALAHGTRVFLGQHVGDLDNPRALAAFERAVTDFVDLWKCEPAALAHDLHPDYASSTFARSATADGGRFAGVPRVAVQHHHAHLASCLAENGVAGEALGVAWDGTGLGTDGAVWGGEFLVGSSARFRRAAALRRFVLPGGDAAAREPRRSALGLLAAAGKIGLGSRLGFTAWEIRTVERQIERGVNAPETTSVGRLFDAVAALCGIRRKASFEGQAAMLLEAAGSGTKGAAYPLPLVPALPRPGGPSLELDWRPLLEALLDDLDRGAGADVVSARFHAALVGAIVEVAEAVGEPRVALTGGCFQNRTLVLSASAALEAEGFEVLLHRHVPPGDGGIALGQAVVAAARLREA